MKRGIAIVCLLAMAAMANGAIIQTYQLTGNLGGKIYVDVDYVGTSASATGVTLDVLQLHLRAGSANDIVASVDLAITGDLYQIYRNDPPPPPPGLFGYTPDQVLGAGLYDAAHDTRFLCGFDAKVNDPDEHFNWASYTMDAGQDYHGWGTKLGGYKPGVDTAGTAPKNVVSGLALGSQVMNLLFAQVVVAPLQTATMTGSLGDQLGETFTFSGLVIGPSNIPEPATIGLLVLGAVGLVVRKRR